MTSGIQKQHVAYVLAWIESERGWGQRPAGFSLHESTAEAAVYIRAHWEQEHAWNIQNNIKGTPDSYCRPESNKAMLCAVTPKAAKALREATEAGNHGKHYDHRSDFEVSHQV